MMDEVRRHVGIVHGRSYGGRTEIEHGLVETASRLP